MIGDLKQIETRARDCAAQLRLSATRMDELAAFAADMAERAARDPSIAIGDLAVNIESIKADIGKLAASKAR